MRKVLAIFLVTIQLTSFLIADVAAEEKDRGFQAQNKERQISSVELLKEFEAPTDDVYRVGEGDELNIQVWDRKELSGKHQIGPDGKISLPLVGTIPLSGLTRDEVADTVKDNLLEYYENVYVTVNVEKYVSNRVFILGRVSHPGALSFEAQPTLLEAITRAGSLPVSGTGSEKAALTRCSIFRGRDKVIWIDLKRLLSQGDTSLNLRLQRNDIIYIPDADDQLIYVLGEVRSPGAYRLTPDMSLMDAIALAGGPNTDASNNHIQIIRPGQGLKQEIALKDLLKPNRKLNFSLEEGDIIYVPKRNLAKFGYLMEKVSPFASLLLLGKAIAK